MRAIGQVAHCLHKVSVTCQIVSCRHAVQRSQILTARCYSSKPRSTDDGILVGQADENTFVCWHPEQTFPYEHTKPLPRRAAELEQGDSVLKVQHTSDYESRYRPTGPLQEELQDMFFTTKHQWFPRPKDTRNRKLDPPKDREGI